MWNVDIAISGIAGPPDDVNAWTAWIRSSGVDCARLLASLDGPRAELKEAKQELKHEQNVREQLEAALEAISTVVKSHPDYADHKDHVASFAELVAELLRGPSVLQRLLVHVAPFVDAEWMRREEPGLHRQYQALTGEKRKKR
jgi:hypothetical protein